jgi:TonB family protein
MPNENRVMQRANQLGFVLAIFILSVGFISPVLALNLSQDQQLGKSTSVPSPVSDKFLICEVVEIKATLPVTIIKKIPEYPKLARDYRIWGRVDVEATVSENGSVESVRVLRGNLILAEAARKATMEWRFIPGSENDIPVKSEVPITFNFKLE